MSDTEFDPDCGQDTLHLSSESTDDDTEKGSDNEEENDENGDKENGKPKRKRVPWTFEKVLKSQQEVDNELKDKWSKHKEYTNDNKKWYKCSLASTCPVRMHLVFLNYHDDQRR